ncbi:WecB/TagA/CpsF family glycosyltransferase [Oceanobacillus halotolerans]|uniref:WecB/TagA/CpsF family glycosyltransferase n=1 Tax=Oceanobacillus halotolerans TaxID=2663380 RepID=UPI0013DA051F|nr:WecB/TagA/CpsF family glycosyltransferase [Oceanobacillus halotolerans]
MKQVDLLGIPFLYTNLQQFVSLLDKRIQQKEKTFVVTANPEMVILARDDAAFMNVIHQATYITADGIGIVKAAGLLKNPLPERVTGYDTMLQLLTLANEKHYNVFLLGAHENVLQTVKTKIEINYPGIRIVGAHNGYFNWEDNNIAESIKSAKPDITFVALGVPRQEKWIAENLHSFKHGVFIGVGGSFDVIAGTVKRAPAFWQKLNLEWFYRLLKQPSRWRRMLALPRFVLYIVKQKMKGPSS